MNAYKVYFYMLTKPPIAVRSTNPEVFCCWADDRPHAIEQARNAYPEGIFVDHVDQMDCDLGGDLTDRCKDCVHNVDFQFDIPTESCIRKDGERV